MKNMLIREISVEACLLSATGDLPPAAVAHARPEEGRGQKEAEQGTNRNDQGKAGSKDSRTGEVRRKKYTEFFLLCLNTVMHYFGRELTDT